MNQSIKKTWFNQLINKSQLKEKRSVNPRKLSSINQVCSVESRKESSVNQEWSVGSRKFY